MIKIMDYFISRGTRGSFHFYTRSVSQLCGRSSVSTYVGIICAGSRLFEVPVDRGDGVHLAPHLAGDAAQFEAAIEDSLRVGLQLHAGSVAQSGCSVRRTKVTQSEASQDRSVALCVLCRWWSSEVRAAAGFILFFMYL